MQSNGLQTILLVDDEPQVLEIVREMLNREGFSVIDAASGDEALELAASRSGDIDLLLTDIVMPQMNGRELADKLSAERPGLRVLYMSGFMKETILKYYGISVTGIPFLQKPFTRETLGRKVREVLSAPAKSAAQG